MSTPLIALHQVTKTLGQRRILDALSWELREGECAVILGPSGGGKTVFLHLVLGFMQPDDGRVELAGKAAADPFQSIAVMFQEDALLDERTVEANLAVAFEERADLFGPPRRPATHEAIDAVLREVRLDPERVRRLLPSALSGGMRRRVALARALIRRPNILIADEPTTGLDPASAAAIYDLLAELIRRRGMSAILITHDPHCALRLGDPVYYFAPMEGRLPRWDGLRIEGGEIQISESRIPNNEGSRQQALNEWLKARVEEHRARQEQDNAMPPHFAAGNPQAGRPALASRPAQSAITNALDTLGRGALALGRLGEPPSLRLLTINLLSWGVKTLPLQALIFLMVGVVIQVQAETTVVDYGLSNRLPELMALGLMRLAPILTGFIMAGRCGSAISAQIGWMTLSGQLRALRTMRIDPDRALFPPLFWALLLAGPLLSLAGLGLGAAGALAVLASPLSRARITPSFFWAALPGFLTAGELALVLLKGALIGAGLAVIAFAAGSRTKRSPADVTTAITGGLVIAFTWVALVDTALSLIFPI